MDSSTDSIDWQMLIGSIVVLDMNGPFVYIGRLVEQRRDFLVLAEVDAHDLRDAPTTREKYIVDCRLHGIRPNRRRAWVRLGEVVAISLLEDVVAD